MMEDNPFIVFSSYLFAVFLPKFGQIEESLLVDSGVPPLHTFQSGITLRWQGEKPSFRIIAQPYFTRFDNLEQDVEPFANLYADRDWALLGVTYSRSF